MGLNLSTESTNKTCILQSTILNVLS